MNKQCKRCNWEIKPLHLSASQRVEIRELMDQDLKLLTIQKLKKETNLSLKDAKGAVMHMSPIYKHCTRCDFDQLTEENMECPKCQAFNYNFKKEA